MFYDVIARAPTLLFFWEVDNIRLQCLSFPAIVDNIRQVDNYANIQTLQYLSLRGGGGDQVQSGHGVAATGYSGQRCSVDSKLQF